VNLHPNYQRLSHVAGAAHVARRRAVGLAQQDIDLARLYSYAFRAQVIGVFHATQVALRACRGGDARSQDYDAFALHLLEDLANLAMDPIMADARALLSTFFRYQRSVCSITEALRAARQAHDTPQRAAIAEHFDQIISTITGCNGICLTRDTEAPEQGSFVVPNLGITIVPLVYGDYHSWNLAWLPGQRSDVPCHLHREGIEIHLGYSPIHGQTILGGCRAEVQEGYAMPIPPGTVHGYVNGGEYVHHVPFIYGSLKAGGWGVFLDVEAQPVRLEELKPVPPDSSEMNGTIYLEREVAAAEALATSQRRVIIPASATSRNGCGGLELAVSRVTGDGLSLPLDSFRIVSVVKGDGVVKIAGSEQAIAPHDHFGVPAGMTATIWQRDRQPLVILDSIIR
jgi:hypothetical protein